MLEVKHPKITWLNWMLLLGSVLLGIGNIIAVAENWDEALAPDFVGNVIVAVASSVTAWASKWVGEKR